MDNFVRMKLLKYISLAFVLALLTTACDEDHDIVTFDEGNATASVLTDIDDLVLLEDNSEEVAAVFNWTQSDFGYHAAVTYKLQADIKGENFENSVTIGSVAIDNEKTTMSYESLTSNLNTALNIVAKAYGLDIANPLDFEFRISANISDAVALSSNVIESTVTLYNPAIDLPSAMYIIGSPFNWSWTDAKSLIAVNGFAGATATPEALKSVYWMVQYFDVNAEIKFNYNKAWDGGQFGFSAASASAVTLAGLSDSDGNIKVGTAGWYIVVVTTSRSTDNASYVHQVDFYAPDIYLIGDAIGNWNTEVGNKFTVPAVADGEFISPAFVANANLRMCIKLADYDWWRTEFNIISGIIEYRANGGEQGAVGVTIGQKAYLKFSNGTGRIE